MCCRCRVEAHPKARKKHESNGCNNPRLRALHAAPRPDADCRTGAKHQARPAFGAPGHCAGTGQEPLAAWATRLPCFLRRRKARQFRRSKTRTRAALLSPSTAHHQHHPATFTESFVAQPTVNRSYSALIDHASSLQQIASQFSDILWQVDAPCLSTPFNLREAKPKYSYSTANRRPVTSCCAC